MIVSVVKKLMLFADRYILLKSVRKDVSTMRAMCSENLRHEAVAEKRWLQKWQIFYKKISPLSYRVFSSYVGSDLNIVPPEVHRNFIEPILNPGSTYRFYEDKNSLSLLLDSDDMPKTLFRSIDYMYYDNAYNNVLPESFDSCFDGYDKVIFKSANGLGGHDVRLYLRTDNGFVDSEGNLMTLNNLEKSFKTNYLIQECLEQSEYMSKFNPSSVNTIRITTYRDVNTGEIHILGSVIRIGAKGSAVDNISSGGAFVAIDENGRLMDRVFNADGIIDSVYNGIDFKTEEFILPNYGDVKKLAIRTSKRFPHMRLFALDIALDKNNKPKIIEVNLSAYTTYFIQRTIGGVYGKYTDSVIEYCNKNKHRLSIYYGKTLN